MGFYELSLVWIAEEERGGFTTEGVIRFIVSVFIILGSCYGPLLAWGETKDVRDD